jgi:hypothetical protein
VIDNKKGLDCFYGADLDMLLENVDAKNVVLMGINTNTCVFNTGFTAFNKNYRVVVLSECVASEFGLMDCSTGSSAGFAPGWWNFAKETKRCEPSVAVTTERGARRRYRSRTYGLEEGRHGNQRDDRESSDKLLHDTSPRSVREQTTPYEVNVSVNWTHVSINYAHYSSVRPLQIGRIMTLS